MNTWIQVNYTKFMSWIHSRYFQIFALLRCAVFRVLKTQPAYCTVYCALCNCVFINTWIEANCSSAKYIWAVQNRPEQCNVHSGSWWKWWAGWRRSQPTSTRKADESSAIALGTLTIVCTAMYSVHCTLRTLCIVYSVYCTHATQYFLLSVLCVHWAGWLSHWHCKRPGSWGHTWHFFLSVKFRAYNE